MFDDSPLNPPVNQLDSSCGSRRTTTIRTLGSFRCVSRCTCRRTFDDQARMSLGEQTVIGERGAYGITTPLPPYRRFTSGTARPIPMELIAA